MNLPLLLGLVLIAACLAAAVSRPFGLSEAVVALPAAALALLAGVARPGEAGHSLRQIAPTVGFLAAILAFGQLCATDGVFDYLGGLAARRSGGLPSRLLGLVVGFAAIITATLTLDATVVLVTPVVLATTTRLAVPSRPHSYACAHIANSGSLLLPVSNLTNLLAFTASGLSFSRFAAVMALPWLLACLLDWGSLRLAFRADLRQPGEQPPDAARAAGVRAAGAGRHHRRVRADHRARDGAGLGGAGRLPGARRPATAAPAGRRRPGWSRPPAPASARSCCAWPSWWPACWTAAATGCCAT